MDDEPTPTGSVSVEHLEFPPPAIFPNIDTRRMRCVGVSYHLTMAERDMFRVKSLIAVHEPMNTSDKNAVAILTDAGRKVGYLPKATAKRYAPTIAALGALRICCTIEDLKVQLDLPLLPALRAKLTAAG